MYLTYYPSTNKLSDPEKNKVLAANMRATLSTSASRSHGSMGHGHYHNPYLLSLSNVGREGRACKDTKGPRSWISSRSERFTSH